MQSVIETPDFLRDAKVAGVSEAERLEIVALLASSPMICDPIPGSGGARKLRFAGRGKGKSGGYRVITFFGGVDIPVFALNLFAKGDRVNLSCQEVNELKAILCDVADAYRTGVKRHVKSR
jgi:hypothetical protein